MAAREVLNRCRVLITPPASGAWNMAVDEALLARVFETNCPVVRMYRWETATVSLGYFQPIAAVGEPLNSLPQVRRMTGGGALVHHHEITYSVVVPPRHPLTADPYGIYRRAHAAITAVLTAGGVTAQVRCCDAVQTGRGQKQPFLCFLRDTADDVLVCGAKVVGSAQRRRRGAVLQHGSLVLARSPYAPEISGLRDLAADPGEWLEKPDAFALELAREIAHNLGMSEVPSDLDASEAVEAERLVATRYARPEWTRRR